MSSDDLQKPELDTPKGGVLDLIERIGNRLPDPTTLFLLGLILVMVLSAVAVIGDVSVESKLPVPQWQMEVDADGNSVPVFGEDGNRLPEVDENGDQIVTWEPTGEVLRAENLLTREGINWLLSSLVDNFMAFAPLGVVLVGMLGIGIAERTGFIPSILKAFMLAVPGGLLTPAMIFIGIMSSMTLDAGYVILPPLAAALYKSIGRPPLAGLAAVFAGVAAGFNANLFITGLDPMLAELANTGAQVIAPAYEVNPAANWYFMIASTFVITAVGWFVTARFVERRLMSKPAEDGGPSVPSQDDLDAQRLKPEEIKGLRDGGLVFIGVLAVIMSMIMVPGLPLYTYTMPKLDAGGEQTVIAERWSPPKVDLEDGTRGDGDAVTGAASWLVGGIGDDHREAWLGGTAQIAHVAGNLYLVDRESDLDAAREAIAGGTAIELGPLDQQQVLIQGGGFPRWVNAIVPLLFFQFIIPAIAYGISVGTVRSDRDIAKLMMESMAAMAPIIVLAFFAAQFIEAFQWSGLDQMLAQAGGQWLGQMDMPTALLLIAFIVVTMFFNLFIGSMSAKYAMFAPIFIPMFMLVGISPELTQVAYRIGDSVTNIITPLNAYLIIVLVFMQKYVPKGGMGTLISTMLPYTIAFAIAWTIMLVIWMWLGIPLGEGGWLTWDMQTMTPGY